MTPLAQQVILITGATDGLGRQLAERLAASGARLILHGRNEQKGAQALAEIRAATGNERLRFVRADFAALAEVRTMADQLTRDELRLDALVNNAGIGSGGPNGKREVSRDGVELRFAVNYLAPYQLTRRLLNVLQRSAPARIVNVASVGQQAIDFDDVMLERDYSGTRAYRQSKLAQIMFTFDLADELDPRKVTAQCLHPATLMPTKMAMEAYGRAMSTIEEGVAATLRLVVDPSLDGVSGRYFEGQREGRADAQATDREARRKLRALSEQLVSRYDEIRGQR
jgi:NAD(P)-dependent dehydrogenase (short-subunit alcohol dehydrogenase family)